MKTDKGFYVIILEGGTEVSQDGPWDDSEERDRAAQLIWHDMNPDKGDNLFRLEVGRGATGQIEVFTTPFLQGELD